MYSGCGVFLLFGALIVAFLCSLTFLLCVMIAGLSKERKVRFKFRVRGAGTRECVLLVSITGPFGWRRDCGPSGRFISNSECAVRVNANLCCLSAAHMERAVL